MNTFVIAILSSILAISIWSLPVVGEGDSCTLNNGESGVCKLLDTCPTAIQLIRKGIFPKTCGFQGKQPIVCCAEDISGKEGDSCTFKNGESGVCKSLDTCPTASLLLTEGIPPESCSFQDNVPIVCCPEEISGNIENGNAGTRTAKEKCQALIDWKTSGGGSLVAGGNKTLADEFPHMAALGYGNENNIKYLCGGSLISEQFVLTAAHCLYSREDGEVKWVLLGALLLDDPDKTNATRFAVKEVFEHPKYTPPSHYDDIALLRLEDKVVLSNRIYPACLYTEQTVPNQPLIATGWGKMSYAGEGSNHLLKVNLDHIDSGSCNSAYSTISIRRLKNGISNYTQICAGGTVGKDTCEGDSGGPLQFKIPRYGNTYEIVGVTSFGKICAVTSSPGVYTKVAGFLDWIEPIVWNE